MYRSNPYLQGSEGPPERGWNASYNHPPEKEEPLKSFHHNPYDANQAYNQIPMTEAPKQNDVAEEPQTVEVAPQRPKEEDLNDYRKDCRIVVIKGRFPGRLVSNVDGTVNCHIAQVMPLHPDRKPEGSYNHPQKEDPLKSFHHNPYNAWNMFDANKDYNQIPMTGAPTQNVLVAEEPSTAKVAPQLLPLHRFIVETLNDYRKDCRILVITGLPSGLVSNADGTVTDYHIARVMRLLSQIVTTRMQQGKEGSFEWTVKLHKMSDNPGKVSGRLTGPFRRGNEEDGSQSALPPFQLRGKIDHPMIFTLCGKGKDDLDALLLLNGSIWYNPLHERVEIGNFAAGLEPLTLEAGNASK